MNKGIRDIFRRKRTPEEWLREEEFLSTEIRDPDGWRKDDGVGWATRISRKEFRRRLAECTVKLP